MTVRAVVILLSTSLATLARAQPETVAMGPSEKAVGEDEALYRCSKAKSDVVVSFKPDIDVRELITWVTSFTCKEFVFNPSYVSTRKVTIIAPNRLTQKEAYRLFLAALSTINYTIVPVGRYLRVVESANARRETVPLYKHGTPDGDAIVRYVYRPRYVGPETLVQGFGAVKSDAGDVQQLGSLLLLTDYGSHVRDMLALAKLVDVPKGSEGIYLVPVHHADASKLREKIDQLLGSGAATPTPTARPDPKSPVAIATPTAGPSKILVDERTNTLIVAGSEASYNRVQALVERLDIALDIEGGATFHVYRLGSAVAEELAKTLNEAITGIAKQTTTAPARPGAPAAPTPTTPAATDALGTALEGQVRVIADKPTNSLIVTSSGRDYLAMKDVIHQLDVPRRQVYIETMILEVSINNDYSVGTASHGGIPFGDGGIALGGVQLPKLSTLDVSGLASATGLIGGLIGKDLTNSQALFGKSIPSYALLFNAVAGTANTHIVSTPSFIGLDNEEAKQKVGINVPYSRGTTSFVGTTGAQTESIDRRDLVVEMVIKPHISIDDTVMLEIKHDAEDLFGEASAVNPTWTKRSLETRVVVRDQQTVVIGGMMQVREQESTTKVPILGDVPLLGYLFKYKRKEKRKTNVLIMLTPYIIKDQMDLQRIHERKLREHHEFVRAFKALEGAPYSAKVDYARKRGLVEEINRTLVAVDEDIAARRAIRRPPQIAPGPVEVAPGVGVPSDPAP